MTDRPDEPGDLLEARLRAWGDWARDTAPSVQPSLPGVNIDSRRRLWPALLAAVLLVATVSVTAVAPRMFHRHGAVQPARQVPSDGLGYYNRIDGTFHLWRNATEGGPSDYAYKFGPVVANIQPLIGDWDGDGKDGVGYFNPADGTVHLRNDATRPGPSDYAYTLTTTPNAQAIVGDWDGSGKDGIGYWVPATAGGANGDGAAQVYLSDDATQLSPIRYAYSIPQPGTGKPKLIAGDWTGQGRDGLAEVSVSASGAQLNLDTDARNGFTAAYHLGLPSPAGGSPLFSGGWGGHGRDGIGYYDGADHTVHLREDASTAGPSDYAYRFAVGERPSGSNVVVFAGRW